ncbi:DUF222 domain-containing protein [Microbacterium sp.]|uniref:HNH endonuclease signature motif containing protein n=1 Tax=Microbacterium sp. TaxID=51671 RepID=UPI0039E2E28B
MEAIPMPRDPFEGAPLPEFTGPVTAPDDLDLVCEVDGMVAIFAAQRYANIEVLRRRALTGAGYGAQADIAQRSLRLELAAALRVSEYAAGMLLARAEALCTRYPETLEALGRGRITERHAEIIADELDRIEPDVAARLAPAALDLAEAEPVGVFRRKLGKLIETARAETLTERHEKALTERRTWVQPGTEGMATLELHAPAVEVHAAHERATAIAKALKTRDGETRSLDQLRADVMCDLLIDGDTSAHPAEASGIRASVVVTVPALALLDDEHAAASDPAVVEGVGPIPIETARELCGGADGWMRVLTHPETGVVLSVGRKRYRPPASLRRLVRWRADRCMAPGCGMPASRCEIDHNVAWEHGGHTAVWNNAPFCKGHHIVKHHGNWTIRQRDGGAIEWSSPTGRRYLVEPERPMPVFRAAHEPAPF